MTLTTKKLACFQTGSVWPKPDTVSQNQTDSSLVLHNVIQTICGRKQLNLKVGTWWQAGSVLPDTGPNNFCTLAFFRTRCIWPRPDQAIKIGSRSFLHNMVQAFFGKMEPNQIQEAGSGIYTIWPNSCCNLAMMAVTKMLLNRIWHVYWEGHVSLTPLSPHHPAPLSHPPSCASNPASVCLHRLQFSVSLVYVDCNAEHQYPK